MKEATTHKQVRERPPEKDGAGMGVLPHPRPRFSTPQKMPGEQLPSRSLQLWKSLMRVRGSSNHHPAGRSKSSIPGTSPGLVLTLRPSFPLLLHRLGPKLNSALLSQAGKTAPGGVSQNAPAPPVHLDSHRKREQRKREGKHLFPGSQPPLVIFVPWGGPLLHAPAVCTGHQVGFHKSHVSASA